MPGGDHVPTPPAALSFCTAPSSLPGRPCPSQEDEGHEEVPFPIPQDGKIAKCADAGSANGSTSRRRLEGLRAVYGGSDSNRSAAGLA